MPYIVIKTNKISKIYKMTDFSEELKEELIDLGKESGRTRYKELFNRNSKKRKKQQNLKEFKRRQTTLDEFEEFGFLKQLVPSNAAFPQSSPLHSQCLKRRKTEKPSLGRRLRQTTMVEFINSNALELPKKLEKEDTRGRPLHPKREKIIQHIKKIKSKHEKFGRSRIKEELPEQLECSESTISRILHELQLQNPPKCLASEVIISVRCPSLASHVGEGFKLKQGNKNGIILIVVLFQLIMDPLLEPFLTKKEIKYVLAYSIGLLFEKPVYKCLEPLPPQIMEILGMDGEIKLKNIPAVLKTLGSKKDVITSEKIRNINPQKLALDEKVIERYTKREHVEFHDEKCQMGYIYCSRRNKSVLAESIEVIAEISEEGVALPLYFTFTPHSLTKREQATLEEADGGKQFAPSRAKHKRIQTVFSLFDFISNSIGRVPLRFDNNYAQKKAIQRLQDEDWLFIGHGKSNLVVGKSLKKRMKEENLKYAHESIDSTDYGGKINVVGYQKNERVHIYLTNEMDYDSAKAIIEEYRDRWRLENTFKFTPIITLLSGSDPIIHEGQLIIVFYFLAYLVHYLHAATPTIASLLECPASACYENNMLTVRFSNIRKHYWQTLVNLQKKLCESHFSSIKIKYNEKD